MGSNEGAEWPERLTTIAAGFGHTVALRAIAKLHASKNQASQTYHRHFRPIIDRRLTNRVFLLFWQKNYPEDSTRRNLKHHPDNPAPGRLRDDTTPQIKCPILSFFVERYRRL